MITIELTMEQAQQLAQLLDIAIKAGGYANAKIAVPLIDKVTEAVNKPQTDA